MANPLSVLFVAFLALTLHFVAEASPVEEALPSGVSSVKPDACKIPTSALRHLEGQLFWITSFLDFQLNSTAQPFNMSAAIGSKCLEDQKKTSIAGSCAQLKIIQDLLQADLKFPSVYSEEAVAQHFKAFEATVVPNLKGLQQLYTSIDASAASEFALRVTKLSKSLELAVKRPQAFAPGVTSSCSEALSAYDCALLRHLRSLADKGELVVIGSSRPDLVSAALPSIVAKTYAGKIKNYDRVLDIVTSEDLHPRAQASGLIDLYLEMQKCDHLSGTKLLKVVEMFPDAAVTDKEFVAAAGDRPEVLVAVKEFQRIKKLVLEVEAERAAVAAAQGGGGVKVTTSGICSWYGAEGEIPPGWPTACGNPFDRFALAAAQPDVPQFPCQSRIRVRNEDNGKTVDVTVNDKGPQASTGRILDLTYEAFGRIENRDKGLTKCSFVNI